YYQQLAEFVALLKDGHTGVNFPRQLGERVGWPLLSTALVEGRVLVDFVRDPALADFGIKQGVEIIAVDSMPVKQYGGEKVAPTRGASTPQDLDIRTFEYSLLGGPVEKPVELTLRDTAGKEWKQSLPRKNPADTNKFPGQPWKAFEFRTLPGNIA